MSKYFNAVTPVEGTDGKTRFHKVGVAFPGKDDSKVVTKIQLFAMPVNGEIILFEPSPGDDQPVTDDE